MSTPGECSQPGAQPTGSSSSSSDSNCSSGDSSSENSDTWLMSYVLKDVMLFLYFSENKVILCIQWLLVVPFIFIKVFNCKYRIRSHTGKDIPFCSVCVSVKLLCSLEWMNCIIIVLYLKHKPRLHGLTRHHQLKDHTPTLGVVNTLQNRSSI